MNNDRIEFIIEKDSNGNSISLDNMPIEAAQSMIVFLEALTQIANLQLVSSDFKIGVSKGSAKVSFSAEPDKFQTFESAFLEVLENKSINKAYVHPLARIQNTIQANGLQYKVDLVKNNISTPVLDYFKSPKKFTVRTTRKKSIHNLIFIKGRLLEIGGKFPNFHLDTIDGPIKIDCTEEDAKRIKDLLYADIYIAAWKKTSSIEKYEFCEFYIRESDYDEARNFVFQNNIAEGTQKYNQIHKKIVELIGDNSNFLKTRKFIQLFNHQSIDNGKLRTVLITLKAYKENEVLKPTLENIANILRDKSNLKTI